MPLPRSPPTARPARRARSEDLAEFAASRGLTDTAGEHHLADRLAPAPCSRGHARQSGNVVRGTIAGRSVPAFDDTYRTSSRGGEDRPCRFGVVFAAGSLTTTEPDRWLGFLVGFARAVPDGVWRRARPD